MAVTGSPELLIVMSAHASEEEVDDVVGRLAEAGAAAHVTRGREATVIGAIGERELLAALPLEGFAGVDQVLPILKPYKLVSRELVRDSTVVEARGRRIGEGYFGLIAGPCTVEYREKTFEVARAVAATGASMLRGGACKPRTSPCAFRGLGQGALDTLEGAREETGPPLVTELMDPRHVEGVVAATDVIQIGARNMSNFSLLSEVGRADKPVLLKRGLSSTVEELLMAAEYIVKEGNARVILCERGIKTFETAMRFTLDIGAVPVLKQETHLPVIVDPSHAAGRRDLVLPLARAAVAAGADGVIVEVHPAPEEALRDEPAARLEDVLPGAELAVVAAPVASLPAQVAAVVEASGERCTVTDVGSTKGPVCAAVTHPRFIGGHPVAGSEAHGPAHARAELFDGATWFLTPVAATDPERYRTLHGFVASLGAVPVAVDPGAHDRLLALTSHLPHALANLLLNQAGGTRIEGHEPLAAAGGSLREMTRVAGAHPRLSVDIFLDNPPGLRAALGEHRRLVEQLEAALV